MNDLLSLSELFDKKIFRIPDYQRGYAWNTKQLDDFWEDVNNLTVDRNHYTGMLSLKELKEIDYEKWEEEKWIIREKKYKPFHIVDGQQRLTTFIIFVNCILKFANNNKIEYLNGESISQIKDRYIIEYKLPEKIQKAYKFGYEKDNPSSNYLRCKVLNEETSGDVEETFYTLNLSNASAFFDKHIADLFKDKGIKGLEEIYTKLVNNLQFNIHSIADDFDVYVAFETMNNRGKKLSNLEILKNRLIYLTTIYSDSILSKDGKNQLRNDINNAWKEVYRELGRNKQNPLSDDAYLQAHWTLFFKYSRNKGDDYIKFLLNQYFTTKAVYGIERTIILDDDISEDNENDSEEESDKKDVIVESTSDKLLPSSIKDYVQSLMNVSMYWYYSYNPDQADFMNDEEKKWVNKLNNISISYFRTMVVASFVNKNITSDQRIKLFKIIEKSIFVFFRMAQYNSSWQSANTYKNARELMKGELSIDKLINDLTENFELNKADAVNAFVGKISTLFKNADGYYSWKSRFYFLFEYEMELYEKTSVPKLTDWRAFQKNEKDHISIEHIFPQTPNLFYWRNQFRDYMNERHELANSLGNLLALSQSINSSLQNDSYLDKKNGNNKRSRGYKNGSHSEVEVATKYENWTPYAIKERGLKLLDFMEKRWDFKFENEDVKLKALGLEFMKVERTQSEELKTVSFASRTKIVEEFLDSKDPTLVSLYNILFESLLVKIPDIREDIAAGAGYIAIKDANNKNITEIYFVKKRHYLKVDIYEPKNEELRKKGEYQNPNSNWVHNFIAFVKNIDDIKDAIESIMDSYSQTYE